MKIILNHRRPSLGMNSTFKGAAAVLFVSVLLALIAAGCDTPIGLGGDL